MPCHGDVKSNKTPKSSTYVPATGVARTTKPAGHVEHPAMAERAARGKAERKLVPLSAHGEWQPASDRPDPVSLLEEQAATGARAGADPLRPNAGLAVHVLPRRRLPDGRRPGEHAATGLSVQLCGDAHLSNFGVFAAPDRRLVFSINDFDETLPGPFEWDVKRLVASFAVAGRDRGFDTQQRKSVNLAVARCLPRGDAGHGADAKMDVWYARLDIEEIEAQVLADS